MSTYSTNDCVHMARALGLAARAQYTAHPNPMVGCVLAVDDQVVGEGWHVRTGQAHAEVNALRMAADQARGATAYVTLEPCSHHGRTPPCSEALIAAGVAKVIVAMRDPFEKAAGRGIKLLEGAGIEVATGLMEGPALDLNAGYLSRIVHNRPFVCLKLAASLDGAIAMDSGESQWITSPEARADVQRLRAKSGAVLTGIGTVLADDPSLNVRAEELLGDCLQPMRVVLDSKLRMPVASRMLALPGKTLVCCAGEHRASKGRKALQNAGAEVLPFSHSEGRVDAAAVLAKIAELGVNNVLVEAGPIVSGSLLDCGLIDELVIYQAPHMMGSQTLRLLSTPSWLSLANRLELQITDVRRVGVDTKITARPQRSD